VELNRQHLGDRRSRPTAFGERSPAAEHQQAAAAFTDVVGEHPQLLGRKGGRLDAAENHRAIGEQLLARRRTPADQFVGAADVTRTVVDSPSAGIVTCCELTICPWSSTFSGTAEPA